MCTLGTPCSGVSLTARLLGALGVGSGREYEPVAATDAATCETVSAPVAAVNDAVLEALGGTRDEPPDMEAGWERRPEIAALLPRARDALALQAGDVPEVVSFETGMSLTLPFWSELLPDARYVLCLRNPADVATSLLARGGGLVSLESAHRLWQRLAAAALAHTEGRARLLVLFEDLFAAPEQEIARLAEFAGGEPDESRVAAARELVRDDRRHHRTPLAEIAELESVPLEARALFLAVRGAARASPGTGGEEAEVRRAEREHRIALDRAREELELLRARSEGNGGAAVEGGYNERERLEEALVRAQAEVARERQALVWERQALVREREARVALERSVSWRITGPLRVAGRGRGRLGAVSARSRTPDRRTRKAPGHGRIVQPAGDAPLVRETLAVSGWALAEGGGVSRIDMLLDGEVAGQARLGLPSPDRRAERPMGRIPEAAICGFEWTPDPAALPSDRDRMALTALATTLQGDRFEIRGPRALQLEPERRDEDQEEFGRRLRRRTQQLGRPRTARGGELRVLVFAHTLKHGGAERYLFEQLRHLLRDPAVSCTVVALHDGVWRRRLEAIGCNVHFTTLDVTGVGEYEGAVEQLATWTLRREFDVVFANTLEAFIGADLAARLGLPCAWAIHESFPVPVWWRASRGGQGHPGVRDRVEQALARTPALIFAADATKALFEPYGDPERMFTAPYGLELEDIASFGRAGTRRAEVRRAAFGEDTFLVLCLGTITPRKAQAVLVQAFARVAADHPRARLALVGDVGGRYSDGIRTYLADSGVGERCTVLPISSDPYAWHEAADLFALSSDVESSPISILEAMAFETPVVASRVFGVPELIEDGRHGYLCEPNDVRDLARALDRALSADPAERRRVARTAAERVRARHDPERYARSLRGLLERLTRDPDAPPRWDAEPAAEPG